MAASTLSRSERPVAVTQRSSARYRHWPFRCCSSPGPRLTGRGMGDPPARTVLAREALRAARAARSEPEFFALLERAGLLARLRTAPGPAGRPAGWPPPPP